MMCYLSFLHQENVQDCDNITLTKPSEPKRTCADITCSNGGTCRDIVETSSGQMTFTCDCVLHFTGRTCEEGKCLVYIYIFLTSEHAKGCHLNSVSFS